MGRADYAEEEDFPGQWELQQANFKRLLLGKKGQAVLRDLEAALLALPEKRLIADAGIKDGQVCTVAALAVHRMSAGKEREQVLKELEAEERDYLGAEYGPESGDDEWTQSLGESVGVPHSLAWRLIALNDNDLDWCEPEIRYEKVLAWTRRNLRQPEGQK